MKIPNRLGGGTMHESTLRQIGHRIRKLREEKDIKLQTAAAEIGISHPQLSKIENGKHPAVKHTTLMDIARYYGKPFDFFTKESEE